MIIGTCQCINRKFVLDFEDFHCEMRALPFSGIDPAKYELIEDDKHQGLVRHLEHLDDTIPLDDIIHGKLF